MSTEPTKQLFPIFRASFHPLRQSPPFPSGNIPPGRPTPNKKSVPVSRNAPKPLRVKFSYFARFALRVFS